MPAIGLDTAARGLPGSTGPAGPGAAGIWLPADQGLLGATYDPLMVDGAGVIAGVGTVRLSRLKMAVDGPVTNVHAIARTPAGAGLANTYLGVYSVTAGVATLLGTTADVSTQAQGAGDMKLPLTAPTAVLTAGQTLLVGMVVGSATTMPTMRYRNGATNHNLTTASPHRAYTFGSALTALPASITLSAAGVLTETNWYGVS